MSQPTIRAVVFDLDGLMFDTEALFCQVASEMLTARGKTFTKEIMRAMIGRRAADAGHALKTMTGLDESAEVLLADVRQRFYAVMDSEVHPTTGLFTLLDHLHQSDLPLAVATSSSRSYAERLLSNHGLSSRFQFLLTAEDVSRGKPDPEIYQKAIHRFQVDPGSVMVLEDSPAGVAAATGAGGFVVAIPHEHSPAEALGAAAIIASSLDDPRILELIDRSRQSRNPA